VFGAGTIETKGDAKGSTENRRVAFTDGELSDGGVAAEVHDDLVEDAHRLGLFFIVRALLVEGG